MKLIIDIDESDLERIKDILTIDKKYSLLPETTNGIAYKAIANGIPYEPSGDCISRSRLRKNMEFVCTGIMAGTEPYNAPLTEIDNAPTIIWCSETPEGYPLMDLRPKGECRTCRHRDPEDKKCDCGGQERQGCPFPVSDDYYCKYYEENGYEHRADT